MALGGILSIAGAIVGVAFLFVALSSTNTAGIIKNIFDGFAGSIRAAMGH